MRAIAPYWADSANSKDNFLQCYLENSKLVGTQSPIAQSFDVGGANAVAAGSFVTTANVPAEILVNGTITPGDIEFYSFDLVKGETYLFSLYGSGSDPLTDTYLYLLDKNGNELAVDDDGGADTNSLLTYTATATGTFYIGAAAYPGSQDAGSFTLDMVVDPGADVVGDTFADATPLTIGEVTYGFIDGPGDVYGPNFGEVDTYSFTGVAGTVVTFELAGGADYASDYLDLPPGELDTRMTVYDSDGKVIATNDDIRFPDDISSRTSFIVPEDGTYYLDVYAYAPATGGYSITSETVNLGDVDPLDSINWVNAENVQFDDSNTAYVFFGAAGETFGEEGESFGWNPYEIQQVMAALDQHETILGVNYEITTDESQATFRLFTTTSEDFGAYFYPQDPSYGTQVGIGAFNVDSGGWDHDGASQQNVPGNQISLVQGGYSFAVILHELGHAHGLAHPHDNGGGSDVMLGVTGVSSLGIFDLNQGVYTVMSYNDGWEKHPDGPYNFNLANLDHGWSGTLSAFDIAVLQQRYGVHEYAEGDNVYALKDVNAQGTFYQTIWDSGGNDTIAYDGNRDAQIDLLAATLDYSATGGGVLSFVSDIFGGYTIAAGVVIENARGGGGDDTLLGNSANNVLEGNGGDDTLIGRAGNDRLTGGAGDDTFVIDGAYKGTGTSLITDFDSSSDTIKLVGMAGMKVVYQQSGDDALILFGTTRMATVQNADAMEVLANSDFFNSPQSTTLIVDGVVVPLQITGTEFDDKLEGKAGANNVMAGLGGDDVLNGKGKDDMLFGNTGDDVLNGNNGHDKLYGGMDDDRLNGGNGNDLLKGGSGNDVLFGGNGLDVLWGEEGNDTFLFDPGNSKTGIDVVKDFNVLEDDLSFTSAPVKVTFSDTSGGAQMYVNGTLAALFEGVAAASMHEWVVA